ncbi:MAG: septal ring factor EnvC (AmiA/AmiB activator), partial [Flavobacteriales bacterium]
LHAHLSSVSQAGAADDLMDTGELPKAHSNESELTQDVPALSREIADQRLLDAARESANAKRADSGAESNRHLDPAQAPAPAQTPANRDSSAQANNEAAPPIEEE